MPKDLYFVDSIYFHPENSTASVRLLTTEPQSDERARIVTLPSTQLALRGFFGNIKEGYYVYFREENSLPFTYGNRSSYAKEQFRKYYELLEELSKNYVTPDNIDDDQLLKHLSSSDNLQVSSFHVNVGHGNCSFILILGENEYWLWAVDCSIYDRRRSYRGNLDACLDEIASRIGVKDRSDLHIDRFFLTHSHDDHFNGMRYLIDSGIINARTVCYVNWYYQMASGDFISIMDKLKTLGVKSVEPIIQNSVAGIGFIYPEHRIYRHPITVFFPTIPQPRIVGNANNASSVIIFTLGNQSMMFPGDLEIDGFKTIKCRGEMNRMKYYAISHHGSDNGHPDFVPRCHVPGVSYVECLKNGISKAVLMGRDGAYPGIYSSRVVNFFSSKPNCLVFTEKDPEGKSNVFIVLNWRSGIVDYY